MGAGIGGWLTTGCGTVSIEGGIITLGRGTEAACIGGGSYGAGGDVSISGGTILLREYTSAPIPNSIGRGHSSTGSDGTLTITGGSLGELGSAGTRAHLARCCPHRVPRPGLGRRGGRRSVAQNENRWSFAGHLRARMENGTMASRRDRVMSLQRKLDSPACSVLS